MNLTMVLMTTNTTRRGRGPLDRTGLTFDWSGNDMKKLTATVAALASMFVMTLGCRQPTQTADATWQTVTEDSMTTEQAAQREKALAARDAMFTSLKARLMEVAGSDGPAAAIEVCSKEAPQIAEQTSQEHGLTIGRTSFRLRNTDNAPPEWATQLVADRVAEPTYLAKEGKLAALLPIRIQAQCLMCHGSDEAIPPAVKDALAQHYPNDQATGFQDGDLRGWFCVEVPAADGS